MEAKNQTFWKALAFENELFRPMVEIEEGDLEDELRELHERLDSQQQQLKYLHEKMKRILAEHERLRYEVI